MPIPLSRAGNQLKYHFTGEAILPRPTGWEVSLHTGTPVLGNEVGTSDVANYARQPITFAYSEVPAEGAEDVAQVANAALVEFAPVPTGSSPVNVSFVAIWSTTDARLLAYGPLRPATTTTDGTVVSFDPGEIYIRD